MTASMLYKKGEVPEWLSVHLFFAFAILEWRKRNRSLFRFLQTSSFSHRPVWRGAETSEPIKGYKSFDDTYHLIKEEVLPNGVTQRILKDKLTGDVVSREV